MGDTAESFPPIVGKRVHTLILGTVPGQASLKAVEYYAHPRNAFWPIMLAMLADEKPSFDSPKTLSYEHRCKLLTDSGFAVWDVLESCTRPGSLDSKIVKKTEAPNNIASLARSHAELKLIICNGRAAEMLFNRHIVKTLSRPVHIKNDDCDYHKENAIYLVSLPSTSPAMASLTLTEKYQLWADGLLG